MLRKASIESELSSGRRNFIRGHAAHSGLGVLRFSRFIASQD